MQLQPNEKFILYRGIEDHTDTNTYYVQAVIKNALTKVVLDTVNLTDNGDKTFSKEWDVPADVSGQGFYITIAYSVYTDSGYTTKSEIYADKFEEHLVQTRYNFNLGGGGSGIDYKKVRKIIQEELGNVKIPEFKETDLTGIFNSLVVLKSMIESISIPEPEKIDLVPVLQAIKNIKIPEPIIPEKVDLQPIIEEIQKNRPEVEKVKELTEELLNSIRKFYTEDFDKIRDDVKESIKLSQPFIRLEMPEKKQDIKKRIY